MTITEKERLALQAIVDCSLATTGTRHEGWWSREILMYAKRCPLSPRTFAALCGSLTHKGLVSGYDHEPSQAVIYPTPAGLAALDAVKVAA